MSERWIVIPNWHGSSKDGHDGFQHYRDRDPIFIKNYRRLLTDPSYINLSAPARALLHGLWLLYASSDGTVPERTSYLSRALSLRVTNVQLEALNHAGFITFAASKPLALRYQRASPEKRREEKNPPTPLEGGQRRTPEERRETKKAARPPRYLAGVQPIWNEAPPDERELTARIWLEGFTSDPDEVQTHLDHLHAQEAAA